MGFSMCVSHCAKYCIWTVSVCPSRHCSRFYCLYFTDRGFICRGIITQHINVGDGINSDLSESRNQAPNPYSEKATALVFRISRKAQRWRIELHHFWMQLLFLPCSSLLKPDAIAVQKSPRDLLLWVRGMPTESSGQT